MHSSDSFLRQLSSKECWDMNINSSNSNKRSSMRYNNNNNNSNKSVSLNSESGNSTRGIMRKRVMVVVDTSSHSKHAMMWALTHVANKGDFFTLLHIQGNNFHDNNNINRDSNSNGGNSPDYSLATSLASLCKACKPQVEIEALVVQGPKLATVMSQVKKLDVSVLVLGQTKPSHFLTCLCGKSSTEAFVDKCIDNVDCLTIGVRKQSQSIGGYLISTRWQKNFWLLA